MATVTKSIGTSSRDYSTITLWEADLDNTTPYDAADDAVGECYNDSVFDESVTVNGGGTIGLTSITLSVASGQRHTGIAGTGARIVRTATGVILTLSSARTTTLEWLSVRKNVSSTSIGNFVTITATQQHTVRNGIFHGGTNTVGGINVIISAVNGSTDIHNNIVYDLNSSGAFANALRGVFIQGGSGQNTNVYNNTIHDLVLDSGTGACIGIRGDSGGTHNYKNNISTGVTGTTSGTKACYSITSPTSEEYNAASDTTASGTGSLDSIVAADTFVSTTGGSEDLHLKAGASCIGAGTDLATTPSGVQFDIDNYDRDTTGVTWDIGADQYVAAGASSFIPRAFLRDFQHMLMR